MARGRDRLYRARRSPPSVPLLGVCLGAQLLARAAGAVVGPVETAEVGWHEVALNDAGRLDPVLGVLPDRVDAFQWHYYTFELPPGAELLADEHCGPAGLSARRPNVGRSSSTRR